MIKTKVPVTVSEFGDRYCLIGPLSYKTAPMEVEAQEPTDPAMIKSIESMRSKGIKVLYGRWLIEGAPQVLLFDTGSAYSRLDEWKADLWNLAGIPTPPNDHETNETIVFGYLVAWFLGEVRFRFRRGFDESVDMVRDLSTLRTNSQKALSHISTSGKRVSRFLFAASVTSM